MVVCVVCVCVCEYWVFRVFSDAPHPCSNVLHFHVYPCAMCITRCSFNLTNHFQNAAGKRWTLIKMKKEQGCISFFDKQQCVMRWTEFELNTSSKAMQICHSDHLFDSQGIRQFLTFSQHSATSWQQEAHPSGFLKSRKVSFLGALWLLLTDVVITPASHSSSPLNFHLL